MDWLVLSLKFSLKLLAFVFRTDQCTQFYASDDSSVIRQPVLVPVVLSAKSDDWLCP